MNISDGDQKLHPDSSACRQKPMHSDTKEVNDSVLDEMEQHLSLIEAELVEEEAAGHQSLATSGKVSGFECDVCGSLFSSSPAMKQHKKKHPHMQPDRKFKCTLCSYSSDVSRNLSDHMLSHTGEKPRQCRDCLKRFPNASQLKIHSRTHTGERPHVCQVCEKGFTVSSALKRHMVIHTERKAYRCSLCGKDFSQPGNLKLHLRVHTQEKPFQCHLCDFSSRGKSNLEKHLVRKHTFQYKHICTKCNKGFVCPRDLGDHVLRHSGEKPLKCPECEYKTVTKSDLRSHITSQHSKDFKHNCKECGKGFVRPNELRKHITKVHQ